VVVGCIAPDCEAASPQLDAALQRCRRRRAMLNSEAAWPRLDRRFSQLDSGLK
jgi:hypothetical protein